MALALNRDAFGNFVSNQDERAIRYLALQTELLQALVACAEDRNDPRRVRTLENLIKDIGEDTHEAYDAFPKFDQGLVDGVRREQFSDLADNVLIKTPKEALPGSVLEQLRKARENGESTVRLEVPAAEMMGILNPQKH